MKERDSEGGRKRRSEGEKEKEGEAGRRWGNKSQMGGGEKE